jgi:NADPH:quinone reductase-like Zn-dependent oxidoreductase
MDHRTYLRLRDVQKPVPEDDDEVLIRIRASTVGAADRELRRLDLPSRVWVPMWLALGILRPRRPVFGHELAGDVESAGRGVRPLRKGDRVFAAVR